MSLADSRSGGHARAPDERESLDVVLYPSLTDTVPQPRRVRWDSLAEQLIRHDERSDRDGPGWSPTTYQSGATRGKDGLEAVTAISFDVDHDEPPWSLLDGLEYVAHTTWKHHASDDHPGCRGRGDCPHWRIILPLTRPARADEWDEIRRRAVFWLCPNADRGAKDGSRFYWLPVHQPGVPGASRRGRGRWLDPDELKPIPSEQPRRTVGGPAPSSRTGERPGDRFDREADWLRDILPGWSPVASHGDNLRIRRPGKRDGWSATISAGGHGVLYVFTSSAAPLEPDTCYTKFGAYAALEHGGSLSDAARALAERYGMRTERRPSVEQDRQNGHAAPPGGGDGPEDTTGQAPGMRMLTETGNGERFCDQYGDRARFCHPWGQWLQNDGRRWKRDDTGTIRAWAKRVVRGILVEASQIAAADVRDAVIRWQRASEKAAAQAAMLRLAEVEPGIPILPDEMDRDPFLFNVLNGTVDLRTGELRPHDPSDYITKLAPVAFDPAAECPTFLAFLERVLPDADVRAFLQRYIGYSLTADMSEQCLCFLWGGGSNGKSTLLTLTGALFGEYAKHAPPDLLTSRGEHDRHPTERAALFGARLVTSVEVDEGKRLAEVLVKQMTGGDPMVGRFMRQDFFEWMPTHKMLLAANHKPEIRGTDYAIWRRIHLVPFTVTIPEGERDEKLPAKLRAELPGILNWAIAGCLGWQQHGLGVPTAVREATETYRAEQDLLADFIAEHCVLDPQAYVTSAALYKAYAAWSDGSGVKPLSTTAFGRRLNERGWTGARDTKGARTWQGIRLRGMDERPRA
jgi:P4 family phage/plasmid primase-like protien